jgi:hypothetical protein
VFGAGGASKWTWRVSAKSAIVVPDGLVKVSAAERLSGVCAPGGTFSSMKLPAQLLSTVMPGPAVVVQALLGQTLPAVAQV